MLAPDPGRYREGGKEVSGLEAQSPAVAESENAEQLRLREVGPSALGGGDDSNSLGGGVSPWLSHHGNGIFSTSMLTELGTL